jgi:predicted metal-dependent HD superfamily phosphohydrolase
VPAERLEQLVAAGARPVTGRELVARLHASGLRVRGADRREEKHRRRLADLGRRWSELSASVGSGDRPTTGWTELGAELLRRWDEPHRAYHDLEHLDEVLRHLDVLSDDGAEVPPTVELAAWFHDSVYDLVPGSDEERSAELARDRLTGLGVPKGTVAEVERLVLLTAGHAPGRGDLAGAVLCDADLAILAASSRRYGRYAAAVRAEYARVPEEDFRRGRAAVLHTLLDRPWIFATVTGRTRWEARARENVTAELARLTGRHAGAPEIHP